MGEDMIGRRDFLKRMGLVGGAAAAIGALPGCTWLIDFPGFGNEGTILSLPANEAPITHIVVAMMENRSFDHWLGWLANDSAYLAAGQSRYGAGFHLDGDQTQTYLNTSAQQVPTVHMTEQPGNTNPARGCPFGDPGHSWTAGRAQRDNGFLAAGTGNDNLAVSYYLGNDLPFTQPLTKRFTTFDHYHASLLGPTYPNREYLHSAQSGGQKTNYIPIIEGGFTWPTIWDRLTAAGVPCRYYYTDLPTTVLWGAHGATFASPIAEYHSRCADGTLQNVTFIDPSFIGANQTSDHPLADINGGQGFIRNAFKSFAQSPHWANGAFILTYDEWGGFFDHVTPPHFADDRTSTTDTEDFSQAGFRVPTIIASPFSRPGFVDHRKYDHTSILRFIEWRFLGAPAEGPGANTDSWFLTSRDRNAFNIGASLSYQTVDAGLGFDIDLPIPAVTPACGTTVAGGLSAPNGAPTSHDQAFDPEAWGPYLERIGVKV